MPWNWQDYSIAEFRSFPDDDPTGETYKVARLFVVSVTPRRPNEAELQKYAGGLWSRAVKLRGAIEFKSAPISKVPLPAVSPYQDMGAVAQLEDVIYGVGDGPGARHPFVYFYAVHNLPRAGKHAYDADGADDYFTAVTGTIALPVRIAFGGTLEPQEGRNQFVQLSFTVNTARYLNA